MRKILLSLAVLGSMTLSAQTYNYFDATDVDAEGWLWFNSQEKIDKYVGFGDKYKIQLQPVGYEDEQMQYAEPWADPEIPGYNISGEEGGEGAKFGAIVLNASSTTSGLGSDNPNGGGIMLWLPDCAKFDMYLSSGNDVIVVGLKAGMGDWVKPVDCAVIKTWMKMGSWIKPLSDQFQFEFTDIQNYKNQNAPFTTIASEKGNKVTALITNNGKELYVHGIRVLTYTETAASISSIKADANLNVKLEDGKVVVNEAADITVYNAMGQKVAAAHGTTLSLDAAKGVYVVKAVTANGSKTVKVRK